MHEDKKVELKGEDNNGIMEMKRSDNSNVSVLYDSNANNYSKTVTPHLSPSNHKQ